MKYIVRITVLFLLVFLTLTADAAVRVIYFTPNDRPIQWTIPATLDTQMKAVQRFYAEQMKQMRINQHLDGKTFQLETDTDGQVVVHHITGNYGDTYYHTDTLRKVHAEIKTRFDTQTDVYAVFVDVSTERIQGNCGIAYFEGGPAMFPATGECLTGDAGVDLIAHELGHAFNLEHDFRDESYIMSYGHDRNKLSLCAAILLDVSPDFNEQTTTTNTHATIQMLSDTTYNKDTTDWELRFSVNDPDGIHQIQMLHALSNDMAGVIGCQSFYNLKNATVKFTMPEGAKLHDTNNIWVRVIDANGNIQTQDWILNSEGSTTTTPNTKDFTYLTLTHNATDALIPINDKSQWSGYLGIIWERYPDGQTQLRPKGFVNPDTHIPYFDDWDHFFYSHAESKLTYDLSGGNYSAFDAYFFLPNPCGDIASVAIIAHADDTEIYNSGELRKHNTQNVNITFDIPANAETLTIHITDAGDGNGCDHYIFGNPRLIYRTETVIPPTETTTEHYTDVNRDGVVNIADLVIVAAFYGQKIIGDPTPNPDVNRDGIVDAADILLITDEMPVGSAPNATIPTQLLPNYPNPFNPETWIPYTLAMPTTVEIRIYSVDGSIVRQLDVGYQQAGIYADKHRAAYWDGRNQHGESVASGVYFYTLIANDFTVTRKLLLQK